MSEKHISYNNRSGFICAGCWTLDHIKVIDSWPAEEELASIGAMDQQGGGSAHNVSVDLCKLDNSLRVESIGLLGDDAAGDYLLERTVRFGMVNKQMHRTSKAATSFTDVITVEGTGKRTFFHHAGTNDLLTPDHFDFSNSYAKTLHLGLLGVHRTLDAPWNNDANGWVSVLKKAKQAGLATNIELVSINPERNRALALPCLPYLDTLIINDHEAGGLAGIETINQGKTDEKACVLAAQALIELGAMHLVVVHYPSGSVAVTKTAEPLITQADKVEDDAIVSSVGAGDAFVAGLLYALHQHWPLHRALDLAHKVAASSLYSRTTTGSVQNIESYL